MKTKLKSSFAWRDNLALWLKQYTLEDILAAIKKVPLDAWWKGKMTPVIFFRQFGQDHQRVDYIANFTAIPEPEKPEKYDPILKKMVPIEEEAKLNF